MLKIGFVDDSFNLYYIDIDFNYNYIQPIGEFHSTANRRFLV